MKNIVLIILAGFALLICGCEEEPPDGEELVQACSDTTLSEIASDVSPAIDASDPDYADTEISVKALDLVGTPSLTFNETTLTCVITVDDIPADEMLLLYHDELEDNYLNYSWEVIFDVDGNSSDDYSLALNLFNGPMEEQYGSITEFMQADLWDNTEILKEQMTDAVLTIVSDSFILEVTDDLVTSLSAAKEIYVSTYMDNGRTKYRDCRQIRTSFSVPED